MPETRNASIRIEPVSGPEPERLPTATTELLNQAVYEDTYDRLVSEVRGIDRYSALHSLIVDILEHYRSTCQCEYCCAVRRAEAQQLIGQSVYCRFCHTFGWRFRGEHGTRECFRVYECPVCHEMHMRERRPCIQCSGCGSQHPEPACCETPYSVLDIVQCEQCNGHHSAPACNDIDRFRNCQQPSNCCACTNMVGAYEDRQNAANFPDYDDDDDECNVPFCSDHPRSSRNRGNRPRIHSFNYQPPLVMRGDGPLWLGMELELEVNDQRTSRGEALQVASQELGEFVYFKSDGSLDYGFEIVSHPATYPWWIENFNWQGLRTLSQSGCRTTVGTGIHIHVNRGALPSPSHSFRWLKFWYRNQREVQALARRSNSNWASFSPSQRRAAKYFCKPVRRGTGISHIDERGERVFAERYSAVNVSNPLTYEVRVFRASMSIQRVQAFLGLVDASVRYTQQLTVPAIRNGGWEMPAFQEWVGNQGSLYRPLSREMEACF